MISTTILENEKKVIVDVSGYISRNDAKRFIMEYKEVTKGLKTSQYRLIVNTSLFECENNEDIRNVCMTFYKSNFRNMYLVDPGNHIMSTMSLGPLEKKMFMKAVKVVSKKGDVR